MRLLLIHQNFPGQFRQLAPRWIERGHEVMALGRSSRGLIAEGITLGMYAIEDTDPQFNGSDPHLELALRRGLKVREACQQLRRQGWIADCVLFHSSWGEGLYLRDLFPQQRLVAYPELYGTAYAMGYGFDHSLGPPTDALMLSMRHLNLMAEAAIADSDALICPTWHQRNSFPPHLRQRIQVIHEGVDLAKVFPNPKRWVVLGPDLAFRHGDPVVTFCSRHLEPLRGLPTFLRGLALLQRRHPSVRALVVGENGKGYGPASDHAGGHLGMLLEELQGQLDLDRVHFLGRVSYEELLGIFQVSAAHVYLTYPYVLSWSVLEAMACGAPLIGSAAPPVNEVIRHGENGLLVNFNSPEQLCAAMLQLLENPPLRAELGAAGRRCIERDYDLERCVEAYEAVLQGGFTGY